MTSPALLDFHRISVMRGDRLVLRDLSLKIEAGEHVALLGPNGCGKSTLLKTVDRECYPLARDESHLTLLGRSRWNVFELRKLLGIVSNDLAAACTRAATGLDIVLSGFFSAIGVPPHTRASAEMEEEAHAALARLEASHLAGRTTDEMSSGEVRRVLIARALVHQPLALLLDEPSTSLDIAAQQELMQVLRKLAQSGTGLILVTHFLPDIIPEIERVILLRDGKVFADGPKAEILTDVNLSALFGVRVQLWQDRGYYHLLPYAE